MKKKKHLKENMTTIKTSKSNSNQNEDALTKKRWVGLTEEEKIFIAGIAKITEPNDEPIKFGQPTRKCLQVLFDLTEAVLKGKNLTVSGYYFDGKDSYTIYEDDHGNSTMEKQAAKVQQG